MKLTKNELKNLIKECLREELARTSIKEKVSKRDDIDAMADNEKEKAKRTFLKAKDDADSDRDYKLKKNKLKESLGEIIELNINPELYGTLTIDQMISDLEDCNNAMRYKEEMIPLDQVAAIGLTDSGMIVELTNGDRYSVIDRGDSGCRSIKESCNRRIKRNKLREYYEEDELIITVDPKVSGQFESMDDYIDNDILLPEDGEVYEFVTNLPESARIIKKYYRHVDDNNFEGIIAMQVGDRYIVLDDTNYRVGPVWKLCRDAACMNRMLTH